MTIEECGIGGVEVSEVNGWEIAGGRFEEPVFFEAEEEWGEVEEVDGCGVGEGDGVGGLADVSESFAGG